MAYEVKIDNGPCTAKVRHPGVVVGLTVITLGLYSIFWWYAINRELRDLGRTRAVDRFGESPPSRRGECSVSRIATLRAPGAGRRNPERARAWHDALRPRRGGGADRRAHTLRARHVLLGSGSRRRISVARRRSTPACSAGMPRTSRPARRARTPRCATAARTWRSSTCSSRRRARRVRRRTGPRTSRSRTRRRPLREPISWAAQRSSASR